MVFRPYRLRVLLPLLLLMLAWVPVSRAGSSLDGLTGLPLTTPAAGMCGAAGGSPGIPGERMALGGSIGPGVGGSDIASFVASIEGTAAGPRPAPAECNAPSPLTAEPASAPDTAIGRAAGNPVDAVTGNKYLRRVDVVLPHPQSSSLSPAGIADAFGLPYDDTLNLLFARHYNSRSDFALSLGRGWSHSFDTRLARIVRGGRIELQIVQGDGRRLVFRQDPSARPKRAQAAEPAVGAGAAPPEPGAPAAPEAAVRVADGDTSSAAGAQVRRYRPRSVDDGLLDESLERGQPVGFTWRWPHGQIVHFDREGRLEAIVSADLDRIDVRRDARGRPVEVRDRSGRALGLEYEGLSLAAVRLPDGQRIRYGYDAHLQLVSVRYPDGRSQQYEYADARAFHWLTAVIDTDGRRSEYRYDDNGRVIFSRGVGESVDQGLRFSYALPDKPGDRGRTTIRVGSSTTHYGWREADGAAMLLSSEGDGCRRCPPTGLTIRTGVAGQVAALGDIRIRRDALGRVVERRIDPAPGRPAWYERLEYADGSPWPLPVSIVRPSVVDGREARIEIRYNDRHQIVRMDFTGWLPDENGPQPIRAGLEFRYSWLARTDDERAIFGRLHALYRIGADGSRQRYGFRHDGLRRLISLEPSVTVVHKIERDAVGRVLVERLPDESIRRRSYDASWRVARSSLLGVEAAFSYDGAGRPKTIDWSGGERWTIHLTSAGVDIESNHGWRESMRPGGTPAGTSPKRGFPLALALEERGKRTLVDLTGQRHQWWHDDLGRLVQTESPHEGRRLYRYDAGGRLAGIVGADGSMDVREHDSYGRLERRTQRAGGDEVETRFTWIGSRLSAMRQSGHLMMTRRDEEGRRIETLEIRGDHEYNERYEFDAHGRQAAIDLIDGTRLRYRYDEVGRPLALQIALARSDRYQTLVQREDGVAERETANGGAGPGDRTEPGATNRHRWRLGNGILFERSDDFRGRPVALTWTRADEARAGVRNRAAAAGKSALPFRRLWWDDSGLPLEIAHEWGEDRYAWDRFGRLIVRERRRPDGEARSADPAASSEYFALDALGRRLATRRRDGSETRENPRRAAEERDLRGLPGMHGGIRLRYGPQRRIVKATGQKVVAHYRYDGYGRRIEKQIERGERKSGALGTTGFLYRDQRLVAEVDKNGRVVRQYIYWNGLPLAVLDHKVSGTTITWLLTDHLGTPIAATDRTAQVVWRGDADAFGRIAVQDGSYAQPLRLPGQYFDAETGWHDNLLRTYDPGAGRYLEPDPLGLRAGLDPFVYADGNPLLASDPTGLLLFAFDGTGNGATGLRGEDISNVRKFFEASADPDKWYMAGVGRDDGDSGIRATAMDWATAETARPRVDWMLGQLEAALDASWIGRVAPVDVIGFSRGAAMARDFVNRVSRMVDDGIWFGRGICVDLRFLGLWDTVAQFGVLGSGNRNWRLAIPSAVRGVWHAVAVNEHRGLFPLESARGGSTWIIERGFVGSHADIGGGNADGDLSDVALVWMVQAAQSLGVPLDALAPELRIVTDPLLHDRNLNQAEDRLVRERDETGAVSRRNVQRSAAVDGIDWRASVEFIEYHWFRRRDAGGWPTIAGRVDMQAYGDWLARMYGIEVRPGGMRAGADEP